MFGWKEKINNKKSLGLDDSVANHEPRGSQQQQLRPPTKVIILD